MEDLVFGLGYFVLLMVGVGALVAMISWREQPGKRLLTSFVVVGLILIPVFHLASLILSSVLYDYAPDYQTIRFFTIVLSIVRFMLELGAAVLLLIYVIAVGRARWQAERLNSHSPGPVVQSRPIAPEAGVVGSLGAQSLSTDLQLLGPRWSTEIAPAEQVSILRRREWAFAIDVAPVVAVLVGMIMLVWFNQRVAYSALRLANVAFPLLLMLWAIYSLMKDGVAGVSIGKRITGCRVVDMDTGAPIGFGQSIARNLLVLVPLAPLLELAVASFRSDRRRLGDHLAGTVVVKGPPTLINGQPVIQTQEESTPAESRPHPLDD